MSFALEIIGIGSLAAVLAIGMAWDRKPLWSAMRRRQHRSTTGST
jgi:hypothetical protein